MSNLISKYLCTVCQSSQLETLIDFGLQPAANYFIKNDNEIVENYHLSFGYCMKCGIPQLTRRMLIEAMQPRFQWLTYNEPEGHLDDVSVELKKLPGISLHSRVLGVTYKDQSTIRRLMGLGFSVVDCIKESDFNYNKLFGLETIQRLLCDPSLISELKIKYGATDILLMRHVIEHAENATKLIRSLRLLIKDNGYLVLELPDNEKIFKSANHSFIWEEHISYFTESSLNILANAADADIVWFKRYSYCYEDSLLVALSFRKKSRIVQDEYNDLKPICNHLALFKNQFEKKIKYWKDRLEHYSKNGKRIAVFGAGHLSVKFINFFNLKEFIDCVIDDNPNKIGMKMPGSRLPILPSSELNEKKIDICISTLNPESEEKVRHKLINFFSHGGQFISAFTSIENESCMTCL